MNTSFNSDIRSHQDSDVSAVPVGRGRGDSYYEEGKQKSKSPSKRLHQDNDSFSGHLRKAQGSSNDSVFVSPNLIITLGRFKERQEKEEIQENKA